MLVPSIFGDSLMDDFFDGFALKPVRGNNRSERQMFRAMKTDIKENENGYELGIELPGFDKEQVKAELKDGYLTVTATKNEEKEEKDAQNHYISRERYTGSMQRSFYVGEQIGKEDLKAKFENGILTIAVPKKELKQEDIDYSVLID